ncbi:hypothetical protein [Nitrococcus mobilis]|uniref:hypothetical protein n=1 Tax=Nitrococcus mobilis TaxID=35797 RepID=UPI0012EA4D64|nr:hypothetical protein [Nitrococcus mobilis]
MNNRAPTACIELKMAAQPFCKVTHCIELGTAQPRQAVTVIDQSFWKQNLINYDIIENNGKFSITPGKEAQNGAMVTAGAIVTVARSPRLNPPPLLSAQPVCGGTQRLSVAVPGVIENLQIMALRGAAHLINNTDK